MDNLSRDSLAALRLGYGVHYGKYKADHPQGVKLATDDGKVSIPCKECRSLFVPKRKNSVFCCAECSARCRNREKYRAKKLLNK